MNWSEQIILLTGGTGSFGHRFVQTMLEKYHPKAIRIFSRDELKQYEMQKKFSHKSLRYLIGDVRDKDRVYRAVEGCTLIIHAAALKHVPVCEYNPFEAVKTNILGAQNIIEAAIEHNVPRTVALSTDKATNPTNLYGATKLCLERLFIAGNSFAGGRNVRFSCVRYGNVVGSRGSVVPLWLAQAKSGTLSLTDKRMTRFWITLEQGVKLVTDTAESMHGGEVFVPKIPSMKMVDLARVIGPDCDIKEVGIRPGEKLHEALLTEDESRHTVELADKYVIEPEHHWWNFENWKGGNRPADGFRYESHTNTQWLKDSELLKMVESIAH
ncbi:MAG: UDP-N-acetylglucosamine 4,6-dehydratase (inverting), partial [Elusimicrobia bacterium]|nr:UDP-N-acetylglucosamine 4,6-dehydratase (inverting) [Elusimicrobiota bacterium]